MSKADATISTSFALGAATWPQKCETRRLLGACPQWHLALLLALLTYLSRRLYAASDFLSHHFGGLEARCCSHLEKAQWLDYAEEFTYEPLNPANRYFP
ncbi:hypothetical protein GGR51DRAFT_554540 [Nemania sp. FL0031]|nr:hypothetical protein GGR51DRAFT_554540 [Nemania sp. FL0031]